MQGAGFEPGVMIAAFFVIMSMTSGQTVPTQSIDPMMEHATESCLFPNLKDSNPNKYFDENGWSRNDHGSWARMFAGEEVIVRTFLHGNEFISTGCSFYPSGWMAADMHSWLKSKLGDANEISWDPRVPVAVWQSKLNGHNVRIIVAREKHPENGSDVPVLHIFQPEKVRGQGDDQ